MTIRTRAGAALVALAFMAPLPALATKPKPTIDLGTPDGAMAASRKIQCSLTDNKPVTFSWRGDMYSRVEGERDRLLFKVEGMNVRQCVTVTDPQKGTGFKLVSREILLYLDPQTGEVVRKWKNPWTGEEVDVLHIANDPVNSTSWPVGRDGKPLQWTGQSQGDHWWNTLTVPLFYSNPLAGDYQKQIGGFYHATEMFNFFGNLSDLTNARSDSAEVRVGWVRMSGWLPWMNMSGRSGAVYFHTAGRKLNSWDELPAVLKNEIKASYPEYVGPPPGDDPRPNETSWSYFKKKVKPAGAAAH
ncbi:MAG: DUF1838 family protein [Gammaproteobacteria bacterium]|nr:DUF1838 family protein [Gammaproteobacteria bacterium]